MQSARLLCGVLALALTATAAGCQQGAIDENKRLLEQQQAELDQLKQQVAALKASQPQPYSTTAPPPGSCDSDVMREATKRGDDRSAAGDLSHAVGYYQDAVTACPESAQAQLNLARAYEGLGQRDQAVKYYKRASQSTASADGAVAQQARQALVRLGEK
jgi:tetratricopeptide (TPR) repeat protein